MLKLGLLLGLGTLAVALSLAGCYVAAGIALANCWTTQLVLDDEAEDDTENALLEDEL